MGFALMAKQIRCPKCDYSGRAKTKGTDTGLWLLFVILLLSSLIFWPLIILGVIMFFWLVSKPSEKICPKCNSKEKAPGTGRIVLERRKK